MSKEAMKLALEALNTTESDCGSRAWEREQEAITALREALAEQPAQQEPVAWKLVPREPTHEMLKAMDECSTEGYDERLYAGHAASVYMAAVDAAPTPPAQRKPLTSEEVSDLRIKHGITSNGRGIKEFTQIVDFVRDIEAKLKEKNNG